ncbi:hypothetical protein JZ751_019253 [Albula glossodonta]|uniref:Uncharacterized protein n=1 Tax=Albula glossodonta TaxID=121402 RepID=A0A8T2NL10_9TELE|nr:hypothetical protein JZ751_019253 [Albula glossodonta]
MAFVCISVICAALSCVRAKILTVGSVPQILPNEVVARVTSSSFVLSQPLCFFNTLQGSLPCTVNTCEIWSVIATGPGVHNYDRDKVIEAPKILSASPYPDAFLGLGQAHKRYYITKLGVPRDFPCGDLPGIRYFRVGADGNCSSTNCNGILPAGSTVRVKYILIDPVTKEVVSETKWSFPIILISLLLSCSMAVLVVLLAALLLLDCSESVRGKQEISVSTVPESFRIRRGSMTGTYTQTSGHVLRPRLI